MKIRHGTAPEVVFGNGSKILIRGCATRSDCDQFRGSFYKTIVIDEAGHIGDHLKDLVTTVLAPAADQLNATIWLCGTPNLTCSGYFYEISKHLDPQGVEKSAEAEQFAGWHFTARDNAKYPRWTGKADWKERAEAWWNQKRALILRSEPHTLREWDATWTRPESQLVFPGFTDEKNTFSELPTGHEWFYVFGIDVGFNDEFVIAACCYSPNDPNFYVADVFKRSGVVIDDKAEKILEYVNKYDPLLVVTDPGGGGKELIEYVNQRYGLELEASDKRDKLEFIEILKNDVEAGRVKLQGDLTVCISELKVLQWSNSTCTKLVDSQKHDFFDALRYAWKASGHTHWKPKINPAAPISNEAMDSYFERKIKEQMDEEESHWY